GRGTFSLTVAGAAVTGEAGAVTGLVLEAGDGSCALTRARFRAGDDATRRGAEGLGRRSDTVGRTSSAPFRESVSCAVAAASGLDGRITYAVITLEVAAVSPTAAIPMVAYFHAAFMIALLDSRPLRSAERPLYSPTGRTTCVVS